MRKLILIKHSAPLVRPAVPPEQWRLSAEGKARCVALADAVRPHFPTRVFSSTEVKAQETGDLLATALGVARATAPGLHEHDRSNVPHLPTREFVSLMALFFSRPTERVLGRESAAEALERFSAAVAAVVPRDAEENVAVVSHGTVIALFLARHSRSRGFDLWREMGLPSFAVLSVPEWVVVESVNDLAAR